MLLTTRPQSASPSLQTLTASPDPLLPTNCSSTPDHDQPDHVQPDYCSLSVELKLEPGVSMKEVLVPIVDDTMAEGPETFVAELSSPVDGVLSSTHSSAVVTILDTEDCEGGNVMLYPWLLYCTRWFSVCVTTHTHPHTCVKQTLPWQRVLFPIPPSHFVQKQTLLCTILFSNTPPPSHPHTLTPSHRHRCSGECDGAAAWAHGAV